MPAFHMLRKTIAVENLSSCVCHSSSALTARCHPGYSWGDRVWWLFWTGLALMPKVFQTIELICCPRLRVYWKYWLFGQHMKLKGSWWYDKLHLIWRSSSRISQCLMLLRKLLYVLLPETSMSSQKARLSALKSEQLILYTAGPQQSFVVT